MLWMVYGCCYGLSVMVNELFMGMVNESILWFGYGYGFASGKVKMFVREDWLVY